MWQEIADTLQAPKKFLWSMIPGLHDDDTGEAYSGSQVAHNAFGTDPDSVWGKALGFGLDVAGDPLNLIAPMAVRGVGAAARGLGLLGDVAAPAAEAVAAGGDLFGTSQAALQHAARATATEAAPSSVSAMRGLRDTFGMIKNARPTPEGMRPLMEEALSGNGLPRRLVTTPGLNMVGEASGSVPRNVTNVLGVQLPTGLGPEALKDAATDLSAGGIGGAFYPGGEGLTTGVGVSANPIANRHEVIHGMVNAIAGGADSSGVPLSVRVPGLLGRVNHPIAQGVSEVLNEAAAHAAESRGTLGQMRNYMGFLMNPHPSYYEQIARTSPFAAALHQSLPYAAAGTAAGGGYLAGRPYFGE